MSVIKISMSEMEKRGSREIQLPSTSSILNLLRELDYSPEVVIIRKNGKIVVEEEKLADGDEIEVIPVVSGG
ncbi:MAG: MoaD/ThiS family protein [Candidatus Hadarchaeota archaeon]|nr:MoaD/ThiS family protein [Candidatus Hadarchaeota archaeon]